MKRAQSQVRHLAQHPKHQAPISQENELKVNGTGHLDHMLRQTRFHHMQLSGMADVKAGMLLTTASIIVTLVLPYTDDPNLKWSAFIMIVGSLVTVLLATYAVMPKLPLKKKHKPDPDNPLFNLLFFGDFITLEYEEFEDRMKTVMADPERVYQAQLKEIYVLGRFLQLKKYRFISFAYATFMGGLVLAALAMVVAYVMR